VTKTSLNLHPWRCRGRLLSGVPVAFVLSLLLAACQGTPPPDARAPGQSAEALLRLADDTASAGDLGTAVDLYRRAAEQRPEDPKPLARLGSALLQLHAYTEAAASYRAALRIKPNPMEAELHRGLATVLLALNQPEAAITELEAAVKMTPEDPRVYGTLGVAHDLMGRHDLAQQDYRNGMRLAPNSTVLRNNYGLSLALAGDYSAAAAALTELAERPGASPRHTLNLALVYGLAGDDRRAAAVARIALDDAAVNSNVAYYAMLRAMDDKARANAIMGGQIRGPASIAEPLPKREATDEPGSAAAEAAPRTTVQSAALADEAKSQAAATSHAPSESAALDTKPPRREAKAKPAKAVPAAQPTPAATAEAEPARPSPAQHDVVMVPAAPAAMPPEPAIKPAPGTTDAMTAPPAVTDNSAGASPAQPSETEPEAKPSAPTAPAEQQAAVPAEAAPEPSTAAAAPQPEAEAAAKPTRAATSGFVLQLGAFASEANARKLADQLNRKGYEVAVVHHRDKDGRDWFVVRAGGYANAEEAAAAARHMREAEQVPAVVVRLRQPNQA